MISPAWALSFSALSSPSAWPVSFPTSCLSAARPISYTPSLDASSSAVTLSMTHIPSTSAFRLMSILWVLSVYTLSASSPCCLVVGLLTALSCICSFINLCRQLFHYISLVYSSFLYSPQYPPSPQRSPRSLITERTNTAPAGWKWCSLEASGLWTGCNFTYLLIVLSFEVVLWPSSSIYVVSMLPSYLPAFSSKDSGDAAGRLPQIWNKWVQK